MNHASCVHRTWNAAILGVCQMRSEIGKYLFLVDHPSRRGISFALNHELQHEQRVLETLVYPVVVDHGTGGTALGEDD